MDLCFTIHHIYNKIPEDRMEFSNKIPDEQFDIVICCSVDDYVLDKHSFYSELVSKAKEILIFESNVQVYANHPFAEFCMGADILYEWLGEVVDKYPFGKDRVRNLFRVIL